jgi:RimJ/RimL family protein N-acetyltransferase
MATKALNELNENRRAVRPLLSSHDPADALASYYALWHDPKRTQLAISRDTQGRADGFVVTCQTGADLFRPLVTLRAPDADAVGRLLDEALVPNRAYQVIVPVTLASAVREHLDFQQSRLLSIYRLDPARFQPIINILVQQVTGADGTPRFQIESQGQVVAISGTNWRSPTFAEVFVYVHPTGRRRGWGKSVVSACTASLLEARLTPLYLAEKENEISVRIAEGLGYVDTGRCEFIAEGRLK